MKLTALAALPLLLIPVCQPKPASWDHLPCAQWADEALDAGWQPDDLDRLLPIMWRESRCQPEAVRYNSRGRAVDIGLLQINQIHRPMLAERGFDHDDMRDPDANLWFGRLLFEWHVDRNLDGWSPWAAR